MTPTGEIVRLLLALGIGLVAGSVLPAEILARRQGVDIRSVGDGNPGTWNAFRLGTLTGVLTAAYDLSVGVLAIQVAELLGVSGGAAYVAGIMTIVGHRYPVFKGFRGGGKGMAAAAGMIIYGAAVAVTSGWLSGADFVALAAVAALAYGVSRSASAVAIVMLPVLVVQLILGRSDWQFLAFMTVLVGYICAVQVAALRRAGSSRTIGPARDQTRT